MQKLGIGLIAFTVAAVVACGSSSGSSDDTDATGGNSSAGGSSAAGAGGSETGGSGSGGDAGAATGGTGSGGEVQLPEGTAELGSACDQPGELACAGTFQKLTLLCGASGVWEQNTTCAGDQVCDSSPGQNQGTCQDQAVECADREPGDSWCEGPLLQRCSADNVHVEDGETCERGCHEGSCNEVADSCAVDGAEVTYCSYDCGEPEQSCDAEHLDLEGCRRLSPPDTTEVIRMPFAAEMCQKPCGRVFKMSLHLWQTVRITVPDGWGMVLDEYDSTETDPTGCMPDMPVLTGCQVFERHGQNVRSLYVIPPSASSEPVNVLIDDQTTCP